MSRDPTHQGDCREGIFIQRAQHLRKLRLRQHRCNEAPQESEESKWCEPNLGGRLWLQRGLQWRIGVSEPVSRRGIKSGKMILPAIIKRVHAKFFEMPRLAQLANNQTHNLNQRTRPHTAHKKKPTTAIATQPETSQESGADSYKYDAKPALASVTIIDASPRFRAICNALFFIGY